MKDRLLPLLFLLTGLSVSLTVFSEKETLRNEDWLLSLEKRTLLKFITQCALRKDQVLAIETDGIVFEYYGNLGAAPKWNGYPSSLTDSEQRWVSACVLARVNYFGTPVAINLRTRNTSDLKIPVTENELEQFPYYEGAFFGNIFDSTNKQYVCQGDAPKKVLVGKNRICSLPDLDHPGRKTSACGFTIVGDCEDSFVFERDGITYNEVMHVWLKLH